MLVTYRPEYRGPLTQLTGAQTIALAPLSDSETAALVSGLAGSDPSLSGLAETMLARATPIDIPGPIVDLVGTGGDGARTVNISTNNFNVDQGMAAVSGGTVSMPAVFWGALCGISQAFGVWWFYAALGAREISRSDFHFRLAEAQRRAFHLFP